MLNLLKRDPLWSGPVLKWTLLAAGNSGLVAALAFSYVLWSGASTLPPAASLPLVALLIWGPLAFLFYQPRFRERCTALDLALPVEAGSLWVAHVVAAFLAGSFVVLSTAGAIGISFWIIGRQLGRPQVLSLPVAGMLLPAASALLLVIVLLHGRDPGLRRIPGDRLFRAQASAAFIAGYLLVVLLSMPRAPVFLIVLTLAVVIAARARRAVPPSFLVAPFGPEDVSEPVAADVGHEPAAEDPAKRRFFALFLIRITYQTLSKNRFAGSPAVVYAFLFLWGLLLSGFLGMKMGWSEEMDLYNATLTLYTLVATLAAPVARLYMLDPLPVSKRFLFAFIIWPPLLALGAGYASGRVALRAWSAPPAIEFTREAAPGLFPSYPLEYPTVRVAPRYSRVAWDGTAPDNGSPWGESHAPWKVPLYRGSRVAIYSPFSTPKDCSVDFVALQLSRAAREIHGADIPAAEIRARYLRHTDAGVVLTESGLSVLNGRSSPRWVDRVTFFPSLALVVFVAWLALAAVYFRTFRASIADGVRKATLIGLFVVTLALHLGLLLSFVTRFMRPEAASAFWRVMTVRAAAALPGGEVGLWALCALVFAVAYGLAQGAFDRTEMPAPRPTSAG